MNQPPLIEKQTGKRIVSKGVYVWSQIKRIGTGGTGFLLMMSSVCFGIAIFFLAVGVACNFLAFLTGVTEVAIPFFLFLLLCTCSAGCVLCGFLGMRLSNRAIDADPGIPITRANTADIPAPDSLVRASAEPVQEQQFVLLRAAPQSVERHEEQLVRAAGGTEQV